MLQKPLWMSRFYSLEVHEMIAGMYIEQRLGNIPTNTCTLLMVTAVAVGPFMPVYTTGYATG